MAVVRPLIVDQHDVFRDWLLRLADDKARARITMRLRRLELGNPGDVEPVGDGVSEMKIDYGPGYRVYYMVTDTTVVLLLCGGDKKSQARDIKRAKKLAEEVRNAKA
jgi:putative addiction module killer protein